MAKFQNLNVSYEKLRSMSVSDRVLLLSMPSQSNILASLTPEQFAGLFPRYYYRSIGDTAGFMNALTPETRQYAERSGLGSGAVSRSSSSSSATRSSPSWQNRVKTMTGIDVSDPGAKARVTDEQNAIWKDLKEKNKISGEDPRAAMLGKLSQEDLTKAGIRKTEENGKVIFSLMPTKASQLTDQQVREASVEGKYRPVYKLTEDDISESVINRIAGEAIASSRESVDAVINNMLNRVGTTGWGPSSNLRDVALAPGQYVGSRQATQKEAEFIRNRIKEIATGNVPDNTNGSNSYRAANYVFGAGQGKTFARLAESQGNRNVGGNVFAYDPAVQPGKYAPHSQTGRVGVDGSQMTAEQLREARQKLIAKEEEDRIQNLAGSQLTPPAGLSDKAVEQYAKLTPGQKQNFRDVYTRLGANESAIKTLNEVIASGQNADKIAESSSRLDADEKLKQRTYEEMGIKLAGGALARGYGSSLDRMSPELLGRYHSALQELPENIRGKLKINSGFRDPDDPEIQRMYKEWLAKPAGKKPMADPRNSQHYGGGEAKAFDIQLGHLSKEERDLVVASFKKQGLNANVDRERFTDNHTHISFNNDGIVRGEDFKIARESKKNEIVERQQKEQAAQRLVKPTDSATVVPVEGAPGGPIAREETSTVGTQTPQNSSTVVQSVPGAPGSNTAASSSTTKPTVVPTNAYGGEVPTDASQISALPIGGLKGDNSVVVDQNAKPIFTMNTNESVSLKDGRAVIQPEQKTNPDAIEPVQTPQQSPTSIEASNEAAQETRNIAMQPNMTSSGISNVVTSTQDPIQTASFARAMAANRMQKTTDSLGGHFDFGASNLR